MTTSGLALRALVVGVALGSLVLGAGCSGDGSVPPGPPHPAITATTSGTADRAIATAPTPTTVPPTALAPPMANVPSTEVKPPKPAVGPPTPEVAPTAAPATAAPATVAPIGAPITLRTAPSAGCLDLSAVGTSWSALAQSVQGRPILARRYKGSGPSVLWIGGIHGDEPEGRVATEELPAALTETEKLASVDLLQVQDANPDGRQANTRGNANGVDLNRNFPTSNFDASAALYGGEPLSQPESRFLYDLIRVLEPDLIIVLHSWSGRTFVNFDGPANSFARIWSEESGMPIVGSEDLGKKTPGSLGTWAGIENGIPILTIEYLNGISAEKAWMNTRKAAVATIEHSKTQRGRKQGPC